MAYESFIEKKFNKSSQKVIEQAREIIAEYMAQGFTLTLRQLYYQFVARALLENKQQNYKRLGAIISDARLAGLIDWRSIEDRTRGLQDSPAWASPDSIVAACAAQYQERLWHGQTHRPEVWIEKEALVGVIVPICEELRLPYFACRGYASQSAQYEASKRFRNYRHEGAEPVILHLGDHDPSGIDMTRENDAKIELLMHGQRVELRRLALNMDQVEQYNPPPNPAKETDSRFAGYRARYGDESWELDALEPQVISDLIRAEVEAMIDPDLWREAEDRERENRELLERVSSRWEDVAEMLR